MSVPALALLVLLLVLPVYALSRLSSAMDWRVSLAAPVLLSAVAFFSYRSDKRRAEGGVWRIPESTLHLVALLGGWPGAFLAQQTFRHKTAKVSFQVIFWMIVLTHQFLAIDSLSQWRYTKNAWRLIVSPKA